MTDIAILVPDPADATYAGMWNEVLARLQRALAGVGLAATPTPWTDHVDDSRGLRGFARVLPLVVWGYHTDHERWLRACRRWQADGIAMANPADVLAWNSDKRYLEALAQRGVAMPPTVFTERIDASVIERAFADSGADQLVVKPTVSGGAWKTLRLRRGEPLDAVLADAPSGDAMIQPYLPTIESEGETSLLFFGGRFSHAVNKRPLPGEFRIQSEFGGRYTLLPSPPPGALALAGQTLAAIDAPLLYARIDTIPDADGRWLLMEAELIEPDFYLGTDPRQGAAFAEAVVAALDVRG
ncbi:MAG TPA: hypothetical protein PK743_06515 [Luteimonas sp.]|nr:hypothetical protein [Luteimonas sp.]HRO27618.1 hypothetical protein [Luteimonas sp.]HRP72267.1 hypothetical protein [Luteimonas sp.]